MVERVGITLADVPETIGWGGLAALVRHMTCEWATWRALNPDLAPYVTGTGRAQLMVKAIDALYDATYAIEVAHAKNPRTVRRPSYIDVPWRNDRGRRHFGSGAIPASEFYDWYYRRAADS